MCYWGGHHWSGAGGNIAGIDVLLGYIVVMPWPGWDTSRLIRPAEWGHQWLILACRVGPTVLYFGLQSGANGIWCWPAEWGQPMLISACRGKGPVSWFQACRGRGPVCWFGPPVMGPTIVLSGLQRKGASGLVWASSAWAPLSCFLACRGRGPVRRLGPPVLRPTIVDVRPAGVGGQCVDFGPQWWGPP